MRKRISWRGKQNPPPRLRVVLTLFLTLSLVLGACRPQAIVETPAAEEPTPTEGAEPTLTPDPINLLKGPLGIKAELKDEAYILTKDILAELIDYDEDEGTLVFPASAKGAQEIKEGQVIVGGVTAETPDGLLREVTSVESVTDIGGRPGWTSGGLLGKPISANSGVWVVIRTVTAQFQDLFENAEVYDDKILGWEDIDQKETKWKDCISRVESFTLRWTRR